MYTVSMFTSPLDRSDAAYKSIEKFVNESWGSIGPDGTYPPFFPGPQPISIERKHFRTLSRNEYLCCEKTDGTRMALVFYGNTSVVVNIAMNMYPVKFHLSKSAFRGTILDGEFIECKDGGKMFAVYDAVIIGGEIIKNLPLTDRLNHMRRFVSGIMKMKRDPFVIGVKKFYDFSGLSELFDKIRKNDFPYGHDGLIFTPVKDGIKIGTQNNLFKWKPLEKNTIDFLVRNRENGDLGLYIQDKGDLVFESLIPSARNIRMSDGTIVECMYMTSDWPRWWSPVGIRTDKTHPNNRRTLMRTLVNIRENIQLDEFLKIQK